jgi:lipoprotein NlpD
VKSLLVIGIVAWVLSGCSQGSNPYSYGYYSGRQLPKAEVVTTAVETPSRSTSVPGLHTVSKGETLYSIAFAYGQDVRDVAAWNQIRAPYTIYPKQQLRVVAPASNSNRVPDNKTTHSAPPGQSKATISKPASANPSSLAVNTADTKISWQWPVNGKIIGNYSATDTGKKGVDIAGERGQSVFAAADGRVVYSGSGLRGYGNLVIIKHNETYYSAYAHNDRLRVQEDAMVKKGQHIADMGSSGTSMVMLHFEVRRDGKPVDPLQFLPKRR